LTTNDVYLKDLSSGTETLITAGRPSGTAANGNSFAPATSGDGRYVVFASRADNLTLDDTNKTSDIFVYDRLRASLILLTRGANGASSLPILAADGRTVVFQSMADNLVPGDYNAGLDIFSVRLGAGDSDNDGMDDNWEITHFNNLARDGTGDFDNDGQSDLAEYLAGTDPTNAGSMFEVLTIRSLNSETVQIVWASVPNRRYVVQAKSSLADESWSAISPEIVSSDVSSSWSHVPDSTTLFYRVAVLP